MSSPPSDPHDLIEDTLSTFKAERTPPDDAPRSVRRAAASLHDRAFDRDVEVEPILQSLDITDATFSSRFRLHVGYAPGEYIRHLRVQAAKRLLQHDELRIADIALHLGYEHYRSFARLFKRKTGLAPSDFRKEVAA